MTNSVLATISYEDQDGQVLWRGVCMKDGNDFNTFMTNDVASRLLDEEGVSEFETHLQGLANTGFARNSLNAILSN